MRFLFVVGHPAHVHLFRNAVRILGEHNHEIAVAAVKKENTIALLNHYGIKFGVFGLDRKILMQKIMDIPLRDYNLLKFASDFKPDIIVSTGSPYAAQVSKILGKPHIAFGDTEIAGTITKLMLPFTDAICTPSCFSLDLGPRHITYEGYHELAYLHPNYYRPDPSILEDIGIGEGETYIVVRLASWTSSHDIGEKGFGFTSPGQVREFLGFLERMGRVMLTTEQGIPLGCERYLSRHEIHRVHDLLNFANLYVGEGATMASEAGVLGTPWIFASRAGRGYLSDQEKRYGLGFQVGSADEAERKSEEILLNKQAKSEWAAKRQSLLKDKIDVTAFIVDFLEGWPESYHEANKRGKPND